MNLPVLLVYVFSMAVLVYLSGRFSGAETALTSLSEIDLVQMRYKKTRNVAYIEKLIKDMDRTIITILIGNNLVNILASSLATLFFYELLGNIGVSISVGVLTLLLLIFGEITPKAYALKKNRRISSKSARTIYVLAKVLSPLITLLKAISRTLIKLRGSTVTKEDFHIQEVSIKHLAEKGANSGEIKTIEKDIINSVFKFGDLKVKDAMIPAKDVKYLDRKLSVVEGKKQMVYHGFTRVPVVNSEKMTIVGVIYTKDLLNRMEKRVKKFMRPPFIVAPEDDITTIFAKMRANRVHLAIVSDDKKKFMGIITLEDILEELVGEIYDEFDEEDEDDAVQTLFNNDIIKESTGEEGKTPEATGADNDGVTSTKDRTEGPRDRESGEGENMDKKGELTVDDEVQVQSDEMLLHGSRVIEDVHEEKDFDILIEQSPKVKVTSIRELAEDIGLDEGIISLLRAKGYRNSSDLEEVEVDDLAVIEGINPTMARRIIQWSRDH